MLILRIPVSASYSDNDKRITRVSGLGNNRRKFLAWVEVGAMPDNNVQVDYCNALVASLFQNSLVSQGKINLGMRAPYRKLILAKINYCVPNASPLICKFQRWVKRHIGVDLTNHVL